MVPLYLCTHMTYAPIEIKFYERRNIRANKIKIDSKPISVKMRVNADPDDIDPDNLDPEAPDYAAECQIDHDEFKYNPVQIRFIHMDQRTSNKKLIGRSLMWHEDDLQTDVSRHLSVFIKERFFLFILLSRAISFRSRCGGARCSTRPSPAARGTRRTARRC